MIRSARKIPGMLLRILAVVALTTSTLWFAPSADADHSIAFPGCDPHDPSSWDPEGPGCMPDEDTALAEKVKVAFQVQAGGVWTVREAELHITSEKPDPPGKVEDLTCDGSWRCTFVWDTRGLTPYNGHYTLTARARASAAGDVQSHWQERSRTFRVDNRPLTPEPPKVTATEAGFKLEWSPAPEPDVEHYRVRRARTSSKDVKPTADDFTALDARPKETSYEDKVDRPGTYWYQVRTNRHSVVAENGLIASSWSDSGEPVVIAEPTPPPPTAAPQAEAQPQTTRAPTPRLTPRPLPRAVNRPPPVQDAPFSAYLPFDLPENGDDDGRADVSYEPPEEIPDESGSRQGAFAAAIGAFLVASALAIGRMPS